MNKIIEDIMDTYDCDQKTAKQIYELNEKMIHEILDKKGRLAKR